MDERHHDDTVKGINVDPSIAPYVKDTIERISNLPRNYAIKFTPHGEVVVRKVEGKLIEGSLSFEEFIEPKKPMSATGHDMMAVIYHAASDITKMAKRNIPLTRNELLRSSAMGGVTTDGLSSSDLGKLEKLKLVKQAIIKVNDQTGKPVGAKAVVYFTPQGRAYARKHFDPDYALEKKDDTKTDDQ